MCAILYPSCELLRFLVELFSSCGLTQACFFYRVIIVVSHHEMIHSPFLVSLIFTVWVLQ